MQVIVMDLMRIRLVIRTMVTTMRKQVEAA